MSKSIRAEGSDKHKKPAPKNKERFNFGQWESKHREGWVDDDDEYGIHDDEHNRRRY